MDGALPGDAPVTAVQQGGPDPTTTAVELAVVNASEAANNADDPHLEPAGVDLADGAEPMDTDDHRNTEMHSATIQDTRPSTEPEKSQAEEQVLNSSQHVAGGNGNGDPDATTMPHGADSVIDIPNKDGPVGGGLPATTTRPRPPSPTGSTHEHGGTGTRSEARDPYQDGPQVPLAPGPRLPVVDMDPPSSHGPLPMSPEQTEQQSAILPDL